jgi:vitamin B12 transporter
MNSFRSRLAAAAAALLLAQPVLAENPVQLDDVVVTATRRTISAAQALPAVIVIDRAAIERSGARRRRAAALRDRHRDRPQRRPGQVTSVFIRGANSNHTLVLIDGVKVNPGTAGGAALQNITPELVERIEIVKGPRSSLYGSEAIGGVINIITRRGAEGRELGARVQAGSYGTQGASANVSWQEAGFGAGVSATTFAPTASPPSATR